MGVFTQLASNIKGFAHKFACKCAYTSCVNGPLASTWQWVLLFPVAQEVSQLPSAVRISVDGHTCFQVHFADGIVAPQNDLVADEYAYRIPNPVCRPYYTKVKVPSTQDKYHNSFTELHCHCCCLIKDFASARLPEYVATHKYPTDYLAPLRTRHCTHLLFVRDTCVYCCPGEPCRSGRQRGSHAIGRAGSSPVRRCHWPRHVIGRLGRHLLETT